MDIARIAVHESVAKACPLESMVAALQGLGVPVETVGDDATFDTSDCVVTFSPREAFLDAAWVHGVRAGYDEFDVDAYEATGTALTNSTGIHGDAVGELGIYDHPAGFLHPSVTDVPWSVTTAEDTETYEPTLEPSDGEDSDVEERLKRLGYL